MSFARLMHRSYQVASLVILILGCALFAPQQAHAGPVAYWSFENTSGSTVFDDSSEGATHDGTLSGGGGGATIVADATRPNAGPGNDVINLVRASDQFMNVPYSTELEPGTGSFSIAGWINTTDASLRQDIASMARPSSPFDGAAFRISQSGADERLFVLLRQRGGGPQIDARGSISLLDNTWHHVAYTYDGSGSSTGLNLYLDGVLDGAAVKGGTAVTDVGPATLDDFNLGNIGGGGDLNLFFSGRMDDFAVYDQELSALDIAALFAGASPLSVPIPEPSSFALGIVAIACAWNGRRRRRSIPGK